MSETCEPLPVEVTPSVFPAVVASWDELWPKLTLEEQTDLIADAVRRIHFNEKPEPRPEPKNDLCLDVPFWGFTVECEIYLLGKLDKVDRILLKALVDATWKMELINKATTETQNNLLEDLVKHKKLLARVKRNAARRRK